jgi:hypothetical protein
MKNEMLPPNKWINNSRRKTILDHIFDLFYDTAIYLGRSKHIQNIQNFFKKFKIIKYNDKTGYISQKSKDVFEQIAISEIKEIKIEQKQIINNKEIKKKQTITEITEPSIEQVVKALNPKTDYSKIIVDTIVNGIMYFFIILMGIYETVKYLIVRLIDYIKLVAKLPFRQMFNVVFKISIVIIAIGFSIFLFNYLSSVSTAQKISDIKMEKLEKENNDIWIQIDWLKQENEWMKANTQVVTHKIVTKEYQGRDGKVKYQEKIR